LISVRNQKLARRTWGYRFFLLYVGVYWVGAFELSACTSTVAIACLPCGLGEKGGRSDINVFLGTLLESLETRIEWKLQCHFSFRLPVHLLNVLCA